MRIIAGLLILALGCGPAVLPAEQPDRLSLFRVERSTNANIVQYDAQLGPDGKLDSKKPVIAYWVRMAEQGQVKELSWIQKKFAYGFKAKFEPGSDNVTLDMAADIRRLVRVQQINGEYQATTNIDGKPSRLVKIYIHATGKGISTKVDYIELHGTALDADDVTYERCTP